MLMRSLVTVMLILFLGGCSSAPSNRSPATEPNQTAESDLITDNGDPALDHFHVRLDSVTTLFQFGDLPHFFASRDSLQKDFAAFLADHPGAKSDPEIVWIEHKIQLLDTMIVSKPELHPYLSKIDSMALVFGNWPESDSLTEVFLNGLSEDTLFQDINNKRVDFWIRYFTGPGRRYFERSLYRMELHRPGIDRILAEQGLPKEFIILALIESGFNLKAKSRAKAVGPWQFMRGTARLYGLRVNWWLDERRDIVASTYAASNYLNDLYGIWNSWFLAMASYNCGEYRVARAIARQKTENFWRLKLPKQTERYVPKFLASLYISRDPEKYGFTIPTVEPIEFDQVTVKDATDLKLIAKCAGVSIETIQALNPCLLRWATPPKTELFVKVPKGLGEDCQVALEAIPAGERVTWRRHKIRQGETLSQIAAKYGTSVTTLKRLNNIRNSHLISVGHTLIVPLKGGYATVAKASSPSYKDARRNINKKALEKYAKRTGAPSGYKKIIYRVKGGDTLGHIAEWYNTSAKNLRRWNGLSYRSYIFPGQKLAIFVPKSFKPSGLAQTKPIMAEDKNKVRSRYTVKKGDTMYSISQRFNVKVSDLLAWNGKNKRALIRPGEVLDIWTAKN
jgi:membrane-bound lytic murein transglycosylase D